MTEDSSQSDKRAAKLDRLNQTHRDVRQGASFPVQGFGQSRFRCVKCGTVNQGPKQQHLEAHLPCTKCRRIQLQEKVT